MCVLVQFLLDCGSSVWLERMLSFFMLSTNSLLESDVVQDSSCNHQTTLQQK